MDELKIIEMFGIDVTYLNPSIESSDLKSKMGGINEFDIDEIKLCPRCKLEMTSILEIFQDEFPEFYFPGNENYALIKTCYNPECPIDEDADIDFFIAFGNTADLNINTTDSIYNLPKYFLHPICGKEIPYQSSESKEQTELMHKIGIEYFEERIAASTGRIGTKLNGDGFKWHESETPICTCGNFKKHILQISTYEPNIHPDENRSYWEWDSSLGIFIGGVGNYHFYVCSQCESSIIETMHDDI